MSSRMMFAAVAIATMATGAQAAMTYNADLAAPGVYYGTNNHNGAFTINTENGVEMGLRAHVYQRDPGPQAANNIYNFNLGDTISFDYSFNPGADGSAISLRGLASTLTIRNLTTSGEASFNPLAFNFFFSNSTNSSAPGAQQNSQRLEFSWLNGSFFSLGDIDYDKNLNTTYEITWTVSGQFIPQMSNTIFINQGTGTPGAFPGAVPEPASWAMMLCGFGLLGSSLRRRRTSVRFA